LHNSHNFPCRYVVCTYLSFHLAISTLLLALSTFHSRLIHLTFSPYPFLTLALFILASSTFIHLSFSPYQPFILASSTFYSRFIHLLFSPYPPFILGLSTVSFQFLPFSFSLYLPSFSLCLQ
jgi:hypothetical protein